MEAKKFFWKSKMATRSTNCLLLFLLFPLSEILATNNGTVLYDCGQQSFTSDSGGIVEFKKSSASKKSCTYNINVASGRRIVLKWSRFLVDGDMPFCSSSSVAVYIGCDYQKVSDFCSRNIKSLPHDIYSKDGCMKIIFTSTQAAEEAFSARYETYSADQPVSSSSYCRSKTVLNSQSGIIVSPKWPKRSSPQYSQDCDWEMRVPSDYVIKVNFMDVDLYQSLPYCSSSSTRLRLKGEASVLTSRENKEYYCGTRKPFSKTTRYYQLELNYKSKYYTKATRGFIVGYIAFKTAETATAAKNQSKLAYIGLAIALLVVISCCIFCVWRRRRNNRNAGGTVYQTARSQEPSAVITTVHKGPDYGSGPPPMAPPSYSAAASQAPYQGYPPQVYPQPAAPYPTNAPPFATSGAPYYPPTTESYPGAPAYPGGASAPPCQGTAPYPTNQPPYPAADPSGQVPYPTK